jgi:hypothetical protein
MAARYSPSARDNPARSRFEVSVGAGMAFLSGAWRIDHRLIYPPHQGHRRRNGSEIHKDGDMA